MQNTKPVKTFTAPNGNKVTVIGRKGSQIIRHTSHGR
jgi:hypothetical protein